MAKQTKRSQVARVAGAGAGEVEGRLRRGTRAEALEKIFETAERDGEGFRHGALGMPRQGKTYHLKNVVVEAMDRELAELAFLHDCKRLDVQYDGVVRADIADLMVRPLTPEDEPIVVFHGKPEEGIRCSVEDVAYQGLRNGRAGGSTLVLVDELYHALKSRQTWAGPSFAEILREGSSQRVSSLWTTQIPQVLPTDALDCTETIAIFKLKGRSLGYAVDMLRLPPAAERAIRALERGEFVLITSDDWDETVYGPS